MFVDRSGNFKGNRNKFNLGQYYASAAMPPPDKPSRQAGAEAEGEGEGEGEGCADDGGGVGLGEMFDAVATDDY